MGVLCEKIINLLQIAFRKRLENVKHTKILRFVIGLLYGIVICLMVWILFLSEFQIPFYITMVSILFFIILCSFGFTYVTGIRCILSLLALALLGKSGRSFLRTLALGLILAGPMLNLALNMKDVVRVFGCSLVLVQNLTFTRIGLIIAPITHAILGLNSSEIKDTFNDFTDVVEPVFGEIEGDDVNDDNLKNASYPLDFDIPSQNNTLNMTVIKSNITLNATDVDLQDPETTNALLYENIYISKLKERCKDQFIKGEMRCKNAFENAYQSCYDVLPIIVNSLLCWPMKLDTICGSNLLRFGENMEHFCSPERVLTNNFGENYAFLKSSANSFKGNVSQPKIKYDLPNISENVKTAEEIRNTIEKHYEEKRMIFNQLLFFTQISLNFIFLKMMMDAINYHTRYLKYIDFDNHYITAYFRRIDERRHARGQKTLLPLKKVEAIEIIDPYQCQLTKEERKSAFPYFLKVFLEIIVAFVLLVLDYIFYVVLETIREEGRLDFYQEGEHHLNIFVNGTGFIANLLRKTLTGFNVHETVSTLVTNEPCLPKPTQLYKSFYIKLIFLYAMILILTYLENSATRARRYVCGFFYQKREKQRVLHLYNKLLKQRRNLFKLMYKIVKTKIEKSEYKVEIKLSMYLRFKYPKLFGWLRCFKCAKRKCLICGEPEPKIFDPNRPTNFADCKTPGCNFVHCESCWKDVGEICLACTNTRLEAGADFNTLSRLEQLGHFLTSSSEDDSDYY